MGTKYWVYHLIYIVIGVGQLSIFGAQGHVILRKILQTQLSSAFAWLKKKSNIC